MEDTQSVLEELLEAFPDLEKCRESIQAAFVLLRDCLAAGNVGGTHGALLMSRGYEYCYIFDLGKYQ